MKKILLILLILILLPVAFLVINELNSLNENESILEDIYSNQLEAILFSVNQYSGDVVENWSSRIFGSEYSDLYNLKTTETIPKYLAENNSIRSFVVIENLDPENISIINPLTESSSLISNNDSLKKELSILIINNNQKLKRLFTYQSEGFRKLEPLQSTAGAFIFFTTNNNKNTEKLYAFLINEDNFIQNVLAPRMQEVAKEEFIISVVNPKINYRFNSSRETDNSEIQVQKPLWLLPNYNLGISLKGKTIKDLVEERAFGNITLIAVIFMILLLGIYFVYRSLKKEIELAQIKSDFVSNVSHELRTPLSLISMFAETLELNRVKTEEKKKEYYTIISHEANRLSHIVNTILNFSKMEAGKRKFTFAQADLNQVVNQIYQNYKFHLQNKGFIFKVHLSADNLDVSIDQEAISEALINLIDNAVKYSADKKDISIKTGIENDYAFIHIQDFGIGISEKDQKKIFEKFYRVSSGYIHNTKGTGLGLSIVKQIIDAHKGKITVKSSAGKGSTFEMYFPKKN